MGAWGEGLYEEDEACDVRDSISMLSKMPANGDEILEILIEQYGPVEDLEDDGVPNFWMVVADQYSKKGIVSEKVRMNALKAMDSGYDIQDLKARGLEEKGLKARLKVHAKLKERINNPEPESKRRVAKNPPKQVVKEGEVYVFPTMQGKGLNAWFSSWEEAGFKPDGWGSLIITSTGREYDWFPWATYVPVNTSPAEKATLEKVLNGRTLFGDGVAYCIPKQNHFKRMEMEKIGEIILESESIEKLVKKQRSTPKQVVACGWSICSGAFSSDKEGLVDVRELLQRKS
ncbi:hypothetical protein DN062_14220 [Nitrincola tibetensis]|uniref:DUF4259 domain-containing protein n=1 Tax=Nitrincola tibetensis TaxID=2219697 RepID=A0A364NJ72_9GAMM|nr:hypothetical protein [Nitrincola tibetensis]RAU17070.1 hypothetical protein DN062_14220 [Nitrincola tibetensis]